jgi:hypothetical protein
MNPQTITWPMAFMAVGCFFSIALVLIAFIYFEFKR